MAIDQNIDNDNINREQQMRKVRALAEALDTLTNEWEEINNIEASYYENLSKEHFRTRSK